MLVEAQSKQLSNLKLTDLFRCSGLVVQQSAVLTVRASFQQYKETNMPYEVRSEDGKHCVYNTETGDKKDCHDTEEEAQAQVRLLHELEKDE